MANAKAHIVGGGLTGAGTAAVLARNEDSFGRTLEALGGGLAGVGAGRLADVIDPPTFPGHRSVGHGVVPAGGGLAWAGSALPRWQTLLREEARQQRAASEAAPDESTRSKHLLFEVLLRLASGASAGLVAGYVSHLVLDATTPNGLPLVG